LVKIVLILDPKLHTWSHLIKSLKILNHVYNYLAFSFIAKYLTKCRSTLFEFLLLYVTIVKACHHIIFLLLCVSLFK
jgi:hypothetical protein